MLLWNSCAYFRSREFVCCSDSEIGFANRRADCGSNIELADFHNVRRFLFW